MGNLSELLAHFPQHHRTSERFDRGSHKPVGLNHDSAKVFSTFEENGDVVLRVSGRIYGCLGSLKEYRKLSFENESEMGESQMAAEAS